MKSIMVCLLMILLSISAHTTRCHGRHRSSSESGSNENNTKDLHILICTLFPALCSKTTATTATTTTATTTTARTTTTATTTRRGDV
ncbi:hypothetical protein ILYODFUR_036634 [Ilyodon furcidens]|uniref:Uncharacterized protein n=1 Tax=Ilyodon furcidens TaxID=33524 RepID=A0ABV0TGM0_9TELE